MLRSKLFRGFAGVVILFSILSAVVGIRIINNRVIEEAQTRVSLDLSSARAIYDGKLRELEVVVRVAGTKEAVVSMCEARNWNDLELLSRLERIRVSFGLDFLDVLSPDGKVVMRTTAPHIVGDYKVSDPAIASAMKGEQRACMALMSQEELQKEGEGLADRAMSVLEDTPYSRPKTRDVETRGMVMVAAVPVRQGSQTIGVVYGGILINRNNQLVDRIRDTVFQNEMHNGVPVGSATIFLNDCRIATTVRQEKGGNRAIGSRVSKKVADTVLDNGKPWIGEAFVIKDKCLTAYEPIKDGFGEIIGMLYVGILKAPFDAIGRGIILQYIFISLFVLFVSLILAFIIANRLAMPIHMMVEASKHMSNGRRNPVPACGSCHETSQLITAFNEMTQTLADREEKLKALNRSYMETLGFVSHELKSPVATIMNYSYLLKEQKLGELNAKQLKAMNAVDSGAHRLIEMVRHYLNLSRIENGELQPVKSRCAVLDDVLTPVLEGIGAEIEARKMVVKNSVGKDVFLHADVNMVREVFENIITNAVRYGRQGGDLEIRAEAVNGFIEFAVRNEGEGIPADKKSALFQKFSRLERKDADRASRGTGLGLFITKNIVEAHGGNILVESQPGAWAEFRFTLPRSKEEKVG